MADDDSEREAADGTNEPTEGGDAGGADPEPETGTGTESESGGEGGDEEKSFRERVEEIRERREEEREEGEGPPGPEEMMGGGGGPGGMGGGGGNPFAQMMGGMMGGGGGPGGMGGGPPGVGGAEEDDSVGNEELVREVRQLRDEVRDVTRQLQRIGDALEDD